MGFYLNRMCEKQQILHHQDVTYFSWPHLASRSCFSMFFCVTHNWCDRMSSTRPVLACFSISYCISARLTSSTVTEAERATYWIQFILCLGKAGSHALSTVYIFSNTLLHIHSIAHTHTWKLPRTTCLLLFTTMGKLVIVFPVLTHVEGKWDFNWNPNHSFFWPWHLVHCKEVCGVVIELYRKQQSDCEML